MEVQLLILLSLLLTTTTALSPSPSPTAPPKTRPSTPTPSSPSTLDPKQLSALRSMNLPTSRNPCTLPPPHNFTTCDSSTPFRHVIALSLSNCSSDLDLSSATLRALAPSLASLSFLHCPIPAPRLPPSLHSSLKSFSVSSSLKSLTGVYLSRLANLTDLTVSDSSINASGPSIILSHMTPLRNLTITRTSLSGELPSKWRPVGLSHLDLSANDLGGPVHASIGQLTKLQFLNLSSNKFSGAIPNTIANMLALKTAVFSGNSLTGPLPDTFTMLPGLEHLDLSSNQLNGTLPKFFTKMKGLKYLNLENNNFHGVLPYTAAFVKSLDVFKVGKNSNLCYNHTVLSSKLNLGIAKCDKYGMPMSPPAERSAPTESEASSAEDGVSSDRGHHGPNKIVLVVAIGLSCLVFLIIFLVCLSKMCR